jgi:hypothetical protein
MADGPRYIASARTAQKTPFLCCVYNRCYVEEFFFPMAFIALTGPWPLLQFRNYFFTQTVGILGRVVSPSQSRYLYTGQQKYRINACTDIYTLSGIRTHDPSFRTKENSSYLRSCGHRDRLMSCWLCRNLVATLSSYIISQYIMYISV